MIHRLAIALTLSALLAACGDYTGRGAVVVAQESAVESISPVVVAVREVVAPLAPEAPAPVEDLVDPRAVALIVAFEVVSPSYYTLRLEGVICPGGASGPTWGIGYDGGHQTSATIERDWANHPHVKRLARTSGAIGPDRCRDEVGHLYGVKTPLSDASEVFEQRTLPRFHDEAQRAFNDGWSRLPRTAQGTLVSLVQNRGSAMVGDRRRELREIRDVCVPAGDVNCIATKIRASVRVWEGTPIEVGMRRRRYAEADLALLD